MAARRIPAMRGDEIIAMQRSTKLNNHDRHGWA
jgi:hypothetical protein